ncbi:hypothetical protein DERF_012681 [Dermatophagoides farinae]|uniref:SURP motif domain-containing protein n=1 Tax=Dermatophagoides farinae TaxID=6954 RepID=A0A922KYR1_DERFA|nr:hypothetical protein DERF_012681 [Dermatophagoides farinae]
MQNGINQWKRSKHKALNGGQDDETTLFVFGYQCKLYRDDEKARWINNGRHLIPWMGDHNVLIDRYDARGYLHDLSDLNHRQTLKSIDDDNDNDEKFELELNRERFRDLCDADQMDDKVTNKEIGGGGCGRGDEDGKPDDDDDDYQIPIGLIIPDNMQLPSNMKLHQIIAKTASFVSTQGLQMEILLKTKQASNSNFEFLSIDSRLHPYYKHLLSEMKSGRYRFNDDSPKQSKSNDDNHQDESDDDDDDDGDYLHPSLLSKKTSQTIEKVEIPSLFMKNNNSEQELAYSKLVKNFKDKFGDDIEPAEEKPKTESTEIPTIKDAGSSSSSSNNNQSSPMLIPKPSADIKLIIDKLAEHVAQNGENFETSIRELNNPKFDFLNNGHRFNAYYVQQKIHFIARHKQKERMEKLQKSRLEKSSPSSSVTFSMTGTRKEDSKKSRLVVITDDRVRKNLTAEPNDDGVDNDGDNNHSDDDGDHHHGEESKPVAKNLSAQEKRLQEFRKRKAQEFLKFLRNQNRLANDPVTFGPNLPPVDNVELSPTIERVTSPPLQPLYDSSDSADDQQDDRNQVVDTPIVKTDRSPSKNYDPIIIDDYRSPPKRYRGSDDDHDFDKHQRRKRLRSRSTSSERRHRRHHKNNRHSKHSRKRSRSKSRDRDHNYRSSNRHHHHHRSSKSKRNRHHDHLRRSSSSTSALSSRSRSRSRSRSSSSSSSRPSRSRRHYHR